MINKREKNKTKQKTTTCESYLLNLGFMINLEKSVLFPMQEAQYLGFVFNKKSMTVAISKEKCTTVVRSCEELLSALSEDHAIKVIRA